MFGGEWEKSINRHHKNIDDLMEKLRAEPCMEVPIPGDFVIVAAGALGRGHMHVRKQAKVLRVAGQSYEVDFGSCPRRKKPDIEWIDPVIVLDVIRQEVTEEVE